MAIYVAASNSSTQDRAFANLLCDGTADDVQIQAAIDDTDDNIVHLMEGTFTIAQTIVMKTDTTLRGAGMFLTTITVADSFAPTRLTGVDGDPVIATVNSGTYNRIRIEELTVDHNADNATWLAAAIAAGMASTHAIAIYNTTDITIRYVRTINPIKYSIQIQNSYDFLVTQCDVTSGYNRAGLSQQDGIHINGSQRGEITWNHVDTGLYGQNGDDAVALLCYSDLPDCQDILVSNNNLSSGLVAVAMYSQGNTGTAKGCKSVQVTNNTIVRAGWSAIKYGHYTTGGAGATGENIIWSGNTIKSACTNQDALDLTAKKAVFQINAHPTAGTDSVDGLQITNNTIDGTGTNTTAGFAYCFWGVDRVRNLKINNNVLIDWPAEDGIRLDGVTTNLDVSHNLLDMSTARSTASGIYSLGGTNGTFGNNTIIGPSSANATYGLAIHGATSKTATGLVASNNRFSGFGTGIAEINDNAGTVSNNTIDVNHLNGCAIATTRDVSTGYNISNSYAKYNTADVTITASGTISTGLSFPIGANEKWVATFVVHVTVTAGTVGLKPIFTIPSGLTGRANYQGNVATLTAFTTLTSTTLTSASATAFNTAAAATPSVIRIDAYFVNGATAGTVALSLTTGASAAGTIHAGSFVRLDRVV